MSTPNPNIALFISKVLDEEYLNQIEIEQSIGSNITWPRKDFEKELKLHILIQNYKFFDPDGFIKAILKLYKFYFE